MTNPTSPEQLAEQPVAEDQIGLLAGLASTRAIRRYTDEPIPDHVLRDILFAATRAPSGSNRQPFRFLVLTDSDRAREAKSLIAKSAKRFWAEKRANDQYDKGSGADPNSPKSRMARVMQHYVDNFDKVPCLILPCMVRYRAPSPMEGASMYPAVQNLLLGARALGYGGVITGFHGAVENELRALLDIPEEVFIAATLTLGKPQGQHGPVRRRPMSELVFGDRWESAPTWAVDPPGTSYTSAGPPKGVKAV
ncbi:MAG: nitroreductase family protein [Pseudomonadota bacterium]